MVSQELREAVLVFCRAGGRSSYGGQPYLHLDSTLFGFVQSMLTPKREEIISDALNTVCVSCKAKAVCLPKAITGGISGQFAGDSNLALLGGIKCPLLEWRKRVEILDKPE